MAWNTWADGEVLYAASLNENMTLITGVLHSITGGQIAADAINAGTLIADDVVDETHLDYADTVNAVRCLQIGKKTATHQQLMLKGTSLVTAANVTQTDITITYANADIASSGDPVFIGIPHVFLTVYSDMGTLGEDLNLTVQAVATDTCQAHLDVPGAVTITENWTVYWMVMGDI